MKKQIIILSLLLSTQLYAKDTIIGVCKLGFNKSFTGYVLTRKIDDESYTLYDYEEGILVNSKIVKAIHLYAQKNDSFLHATLSPLDINPQVIRKYLHTSFQEEKAAGLEFYFDKENQLKAGALFIKSSNPLYCDQEVLESSIIPD